MAAKKTIKPKKAAKKTRTEEEYQELRKATVALANCAVLTLASNGTGRRSTSTLSTWSASATTVTRTSRSPSPSASADRAILGA
jgi:hypothetical protein